MTLPFSILDLAPVIEGETPADAFRNSLDLAQHAERWGYHRFWLAEHHNMSGIASAATSIVIGHIAGGTKTIRVGAGGVMLPNHSPLVIAEQFGTLESLFPGRIDLGLGRAPGTDILTAQALRRDQYAAAESFPEDVLELMSYFEPVKPAQRIRAVPGAGLAVPVWLLGSSLFSAELAASLGLPFAFASHFAPGLMMQAIEVYRTQFRPSARLRQSYLMLGVPVFAADSDAEAARLFSSAQQQFVSLRRGTPGLLPPPIADIDQFWTASEKAGIEQSLALAMAGSPDTVQRGLQRFVDLTEPDELMVTGQIYDHQARLKSFAIAARLRVTLTPRRVTV
ncbi:MAG: LLM class flavin-dependent oxidoreductase [Gemmatimonadota bacterium]